MPLCNALPSSACQLARSVTRAACHGILPCLTTEIGPACRDCHAGVPVHASVRVAVAH